MGCSAFPAIGGIENQCQDMDALGRRSGACLELFGGRGVCKQKVGEYKKEDGGGFLWM